MKVALNGKMIRASRTRGASLSGCLLFLFMVGVLGYLGFKFGEAGWDYIQIRQKTLEALNWAVANPPKSEMEIVKKVINNAIETNIELTPRDVRVRQTAETLTIIVTWVRYIDLPYYTYPWKFEVSLSEIKRWNRGGLIIK
jgi:hypothetical protein